MAPVQHEAADGLWLEQQGQISRVAQNVAAGSDGAGIDKDGVRYQIAVIRAHLEQMEKLLDL